MAKMKQESYDVCLEKYRKVRMGYLSSYSYCSDPIKLAISASRYKFVSKMFSGFEKVLEIGCSDGFYSPIVAQRVKTLTITDYDPIFVNQAKENVLSKNIQIEHFDPVSCSYHEKQNGIYALDVLEHIPKTNEHNFMKNIVKSLVGGGLRFSECQA